MDLLSQRLERNHVRPKLEKKEHVLGVLSPTLHGAKKLWMHLPLQMLTSKSHQVLVPVLT